MDIYVRKRDGSLVTFDRSRIYNAIKNAAISTNKIDEVYCNQVTDRVLKRLNEEPNQTLLESPKVNSQQSMPIVLEISLIQKIVEEQLMKSQYPEIARVYIEYRHDRDIAREQNSFLNQTIRGLVDQTDISILNENANKDSKVIPTQRDLLAGIVAKHYALKYMLPKDVANAHESGEIHYHDLDYAPFFPMFNCMLIDLEGMLANGFKMGNAQIERPKSIATATAVTAQIIAQVASHIYGGTTINRIDEVLAPYVYASLDKHRYIASQWQIPDSEAYALSQTEKECFDAFQSLEYEVNTLHTANGQTPFVTFGFGLGTCKAARMIQQAILNNRIIGLGKNKRTAVFPKLVFALKAGLNLAKTDPNYDIKQLALKSASLRMYPDILNYEQVVEVTGSFKTPMGCRSFLNHYEQNGQTIHEGRNNLGVVTINLPRIALESKTDITYFWQLLEQRVLVAKNALLTRIERLKGVKASVAPILYMEGACGVRLRANENIIEIFKHGRASISLGYIGLHETMNALFGEEPHYVDSEIKQKTALAVLNFLKTKITTWQAETGYGFSLYATPSENLCDRFCRLDTKVFGLVKGVTDKGYYTNSFHLDVEKKVNPFDKIDIEAHFPKISTGGFICYGEYPNLQHNLKALEDVWDYSYKKVPYYGMNTPIDACYQCGFTGEFLAKSKGFVCPGCGNHDSETVSVTRRVCGYLGNPDTRAFNAGKQQEVMRRVKHM
ncbi:anaerobic ribonucleoside-triphosphate reductase [Thorsellia anophelis]|uniref:Ribonucleoside-triphosphate reductase class III catalytic subunit n=1 Tax=Thorsellia anophelis DSM 18579 TaxID=1123402 RepID=A0A1I0DT43_9GAMM|nr:anaerobic ribonucleoside-triphosphate reductase [Thorsellia anophelis]SET35381.1 ribonucleoside-triphosphate reductase class III catalytic subunit [Thorsellia anophelis DSM 18579]